jgi:hypothetical protein
MKKPDRFLELRVHELGISPGCTGICAGYERGQWRAEELADHAMTWLPEFALSVSECEKINHANAALFMRRAAKAVYETKKFEKRGEFGELFLHIAIREAFDSIPAISKIYYKTANNDNVKGFDAVHVVGPPDDLELWIGEAKFYDSITNAIKDVVSEIIDHTQTNYLRSEFMLITNKIDSSWKHAEALKILLNPNISLDKVFKRVCIPVLLTYDSPVIAAHKICNAEYEDAFKNEILTHWKAFSQKKLPTDIRIHLFLLPLKSKNELITFLDKKLKSWQTI